MTLEKLFKKEKENADIEAPSFEMMWGKASGKDLKSLFREERESNRRDVPSFVATRRRSEKRADREISWWKLSAALSSVVAVALFATHNAFNQASEVQLIVSTIEIPSGYDHLLVLPHDEFMSSVPEIHTAKVSGSIFMSSVPSIGL